LGCFGLAAAEAEAGGGAFAFGVAIGLALRAIAGAVLLGVGVVLGAVAFGVIFREVSRRSRVWVRVWGLAAGAWSRVGGGPVVLCEGNSGADGADEERGTIKTSQSLLKVVVIDLPMGISRARWCKGIHTCE
jgi:hypothetical protein